MDGVRRSPWQAAYVKELQARIAAAEGAKASAALKAMHAEEEEKRALLERLTQAVGPERR